MFAPITQPEIQPGDTVTLAGVTVSREAAETIYGLNELKALPEVAEKVRDIASDPNGSIQELTEAITSDAALASKLLKLANSAFYGLPSRVGSVHRAIVVLGFKTVQSLALAGSLCSLFRSGKISESFSSRNLWEHCLGVAVAARNIARRIENADPDEAFLGGITHDVGLLAIRDARPEKLAAAIGLAEGGENLLEAERGLIGTDHTEVGLALTSVWRFPDYLRFVCRCHHSPDLSQGKFDILLHVVHLADCLCDRRRIGFYLGNQDSEVPGGSLRRIGLDKTGVDEIAESLTENISEAESVFS